MNLTKKKICYELNTVEPVENLIKSSFPPDEQDHGTFTKIGRKTDGKFVLYLAVPGELRSKGYGAAIIEDVRRIFRWRIYPESI